VVPAPLTLHPLFGADPNSGITATRTYKVATLQTIDGHLGELSDTFGLNWTCFGNVIEFDPRYYWRADGQTNGLFLPDDFENPMLTPETTWGDLDLTIEGMDLATQVYVGGQGRGISGYPNTVTGSYGTYSGFGLQAATTDVIRSGREVEIEAGSVRGAQQAAPQVMIGQLGLAPNFGSIIPGCQYKLDFPDIQCALEIPVITFDPYQYQFDAIYTITEVNRVRLDQLDVTVAKNGEGFSEEVLGTFVAVAH
jgi:hypothetical protein